MNDDQSRLIRRKEEIEGKFSFSQIASNHFSLPSSGSKYERQREYRLNSFLFLSEYLYLCVQGYKECKWHDIWMNFVRMNSIFQGWHVTSDNLIIHLHLSPPHHPFPFFKRRDIAAPVASHPRTTRQPVPSVKCLSRQCHSFNSVSCCCRMETELNWNWWGWLSGGVKMAELNDGTPYHLSSTLLWLI